MLLESVIFMKLLLSNFCHMLVVCICILAFRRAEKKLLAFVMLEAKHDVFDLLQNELSALMTSRKACHASKDHVDLCLQ